MKKLLFNNRRKNYIHIYFFLITFVLLTLIYPPLFQQFNKVKSKEYFENVFIYTINGKEYFAKRINSDDIEQMKKDMKASLKTSSLQNNIIINGHGTGYSITDPEDLEKLNGRLMIMESIHKYEQKFRASIDLSSQIYFPPVGDQGSQGSCTAWANAYYAYGYLETKDHGWNASSGNPNYLLSPAWAYNIIAAQDYGSIPYEVAQVLIDWGIPTLDAMPYNDSDVSKWGNETAWREAPYHRPLNYTLISYEGSSTIDTIKSLIDSEIPVTFGIDAYQYYNGLNKSSGDFILSSSEYDPSGSLNHAQCIVGYDDSIVEGSDVGAFRIVNSWGASWMNNGFYWLTYDAFRELADAIGQVLLFFTDRIDYNPNLITTWRFNPSPIRMQDIITLGVGPFNAPLGTITPHYDNDVNNLFPDFMTLDISSFYPEYLSNNETFFYLEIGTSDSSGIINSFKIERYEGGILQEITPESPDVPKETPTHVNATFMIFEHDLKVLLSTPTSPKINNSYIIEARVINNGKDNESEVNLSLYINDLLVNSTTMSNFPIGANCTIFYNWTPTYYDIYNITAKARPISGEHYLSNNHKTELLTVLGVLFYDDFENDLSKWDAITGLWHLTNNSSSWPNPYHSPIHSMWFGNESTGTFNTGERAIGNLTSIQIDLTRTHVAILEFYHWREGEGSIFDVSNIYVSVDDVSWDLIYSNSENYVAPWEKVTIDLQEYIGNSSVRIRFNFDTKDEMYNNFHGWLIDDVIIWGTGEYPHDLQVSLETPEQAEINKTCIINASVSNIGTNDEQDVLFILYLDNNIIEMISIENLTVGEKKAINYSWTPLNFGDYNFTAYVVPVPDEKWIDNNKKTKFIHIHEGHLFNGMYINYTFKLEGFGRWNSQISYTSLSKNLFHVDWKLSINKTYFSGFWDVDDHTRLIENAGGLINFGNNVHTPFWIFTDTSIGDLIPIVVNGEGDYIFNVTRNLLYELPGFGLVGVWEIEDLKNPECIAWYEKSTGILLNGTFIYNEGLYNYTFEFVDTNANIITKDPPANFTLSSNAGDPDLDGSFNLTWTFSLRANNYSIYRYSSYISEINDSLILLEKNLVGLSLELSGYETGKYYFIVVARNNYGNTLSNCIEINVKIIETPAIPGYPLILISAFIGVCLILMLKFRRIRIK
ncbi:MAG: CARDB domain-containing protein [Promethearchaeota archaeon]